MSKKIYKVPYYTLIILLLIMSLLYVFPLANTSPAVYSTNTSQADLHEGFTNILLITSTLVFCGFCIGYIFDKYMTFSTILIVLYGLITIKLMGIPYKRYFDIDYVRNSFETHDENNIIMRFTYDKWEAESGGDLLSSLRCDIGRYICVIVTIAAFIMIISAIIVMIYMAFNKSNTYKNTKECYIKTRRMRIYNMLLKIGAVAFLAVTPIIKYRNSYGVETAVDNVLYYGLIVCIALEMVSNGFAKRKRTESGTGYILLMVYLYFGVLWAYSSIIITVLYMFYVSAGLVGINIREKT